MVKEGSVWAHATPYLFYCAAAVALGDLIFGVDTGSFGSLQALPSWLRTFGDYDAKTGTYKMSTQRTSVVNSIVWPGKLAGTLVFEPIVERTGYKNMMYIVSVIQIIGIIIQMTAHEWIQFSMGRIVCYFAVGMVENAVPSYHAEIAPAKLRGLFAGSIMMINTGGNLWGAGMSRAFYTETEKKGWLIPVGVELIPAVLILVLVPFCVESPRWLLLRGKKEAAITALDRIRPAEACHSGLNIAEIDTLEQMIQDDRNANKGRWIDLFRTNHFRRVSIASWLFFFQQTTAGQFVNSYGPTFYKQIGFGPKSFTYATLTVAMGVVGALVCILTVDYFGRRPLLIVTIIGQIIFVSVVAALGSKSPNISVTQANAVVASFILLYFWLKMGLSSLCYLIAAEIGGVSMRKKIIAVATAWDVCAAFLATYAFPYILGEPQNLGAKVGWILCGLSVAALVFVLLFVPELAHRSLEEVDELFEMNIWAWQFKKAQTHGAGHMITQLEQGLSARTDGEVEKGQTDHHEESGEGGKV